VSDTARRALALVVLGLLVAGGVALATTSSDEASDVLPSHQAVDGPAIATPRAISSAWYCAEGTSSLDGRAIETVIVGNLEPKPIDITTTVMPGGSTPVKSVNARLRAYEQRRIPIADLIRAPEPGVVVEVFGGRAVVEHEVESRDDVAVGPCARGAATRWYFADGTTDRGAEDWLVLFNPFDTDAIVDVTLLTDTGLQTPDALHALVIPRRSRVSIGLHDVASRQNTLGTAVVARTGRIVAERTARFDGTDTRRGIAMTLGATGPARRWRFPVGDSQEGAAQSMSIANFAGRRAEVSVRLVLDGVTKLPAENVVVPAKRVKRIDIGAKVTSGKGYSVEVRSTRGAPVVPGAFGAWATPAPFTGVASTTGTVTTARRWAFAVGRLDRSGDTLIDAVNAGTKPVTVQLYAYTAGDPNSPKSAPAIAVPPGERAVFSLGERGIEPNQVLVVAAEGPIVVGREIYGPGASVAPGVPDP
jgi:hypothetical protein